MIDSLISIIIPAYNRENLIEETLQSIIDQTYTNWECILVDDCSTDGTFFVMQEYQEKDSRFKSYLRPKELKKGANACRNYGFSKTKGEYVKWFDSDDIMLPNHLEKAYKAIVDNKADFVITDLVNFTHEDRVFLGKVYDFEKSKISISPENFAFYKMGWTTVDFLGLKSILENINFNESISDGDEYNFFIKLLHQTCKGVFVDEVLTHRRIHSDCVTIQNRQNEAKYLLIKAIIKFHTAKDLVEYNNSKLIKWFLSGYMHLAYTLTERKTIVPFLKPSFRLICQYFSFFKGCSFLFSLVCVRFIGKGYLFLNYARK